ncbi:oxidoreductase [Acetobacter orientalis]|uniref:Oxidoreductase n=1 Tax=Acetobacter orientalis TaxID=146474 RepID=A0A2Z5ZGZ9_9PROT|nr:oxidoreductase [Acetobacter orientalis]
MNKPLQILVSGPGLIGKQHIALIDKKTDCQLAAIVTPEPDAASSFNVPLFTNIESALAAIPLDAAIISAPNAFHAEQVMACIQHGVPVLVEKPMTESLQTARTLVELSEACHVPVLVGHHRAYSPLLKVAQDFLKSPQFGQAVALQGTAVFYKPNSYFKAGPWRTRQGGGPLLINLIHEVGLMRFFFGEIKSVTAIASHAIRKFEVEDTVAMTLRFKNGSLGTFLLSDCAASNKSWELTSGENPNYPTHPQDDCYHFVGTNGSLDFPSMNVRYYGQDTDPSWWNTFQYGRLQINRQPPLQKQLEHFVDVIRHKASPLVSARDGYLNILVVQAINDAINTQSTIQIADVAEPLIEKP